MPLVCKFCTASFSRYLPLLRKRTERSGFLEDLLGEEVRGGIGDRARGGKEGGGLVKDGER